MIPAKAFNEVLTVHGFIGLLDSPPVGGGSKSQSETQVVKLIPRCMYFSARFLALWARGMRSHEKCFHNKLHRWRGCASGGKALYAISGCHLLVVAWRPRKRL